MENDRSKRRKILKSIVVFIAYIVIFVFLIRYITANEDIMQRLLNSSLQDIILGCLCSFISVVLAGLLDVTCVKAYGVSIRRTESVGLTFVASALNLFLPLQAGSVLKAAYLKKKMKLTYSRYIAMASGTAVIGILVSVFLLLLSLVMSFFKWKIDIIYVWLLAIFIGMLSIILMLVIKFKKTILKIIPFKKLTIPVIEGFFELSTNTHTVIFVWLNQSISAFIGGVRFFYIFKVLGKNSGIVNSMLYYSIYAFSSSFPILPGGIGISEVLVGITNMILGSDFDIGVTVVLVNRIYNYLVITAGALISALFLFVIPRKK